MNCISRWRPPWRSLAALAFAAAACGRATPQPTPAPPTGTPAPSPAPSSTPSPALITYQHLTGAFRIDAPSNWTIEDRSSDRSLLVILSAPLPDDVAVSIYIVNNGGATSEDAMARAIDDFIVAVHVDAAQFKEHARERLADGSIRVVADWTAAGGAPGLLNVLFEQRGPFFSALEYRVAGAQFDRQRDTINAITASYQVNTESAFGGGLPAGTVAGDALEVVGMTLWSSPSGAAVVTGEVRNLSGQDLEFADFTYLPDALQPGAAAQFEHTVTNLGGAASTFYLQAEGAAQTP